MLLSPKLHSFFIVVFTLLAGSLLAGCGLSLASDITPPPNYRPPTPAAVSEASASQVFPLVPPDPSQGKAIYEEKCLPCHGETGKGDGPQASNLPNPAAPIGSADLARQSRPADWFNIVTNGNLERFMPGFSSLDDRQRWNVVAYVYTLSTTQDELAQGKTVYDEQCAACHGETGKGDGPQAASLSTQPTNWTDQSRLMQLSAQEMSDVVASGQGEMPAFGDKLDETQRMNLVAYVRSLGFAAPGSAPAENASAGTQSTPSSGSGSESSASANPSDASAGNSQPELTSINVSGKITNASTGGALPQGMQVNLLAFDGMTPAFDETVDAQSDGTYRFENVDYKSTYVYFARVLANNTSYNSDILHAKDITSQDVALPVQIFDTSTDASVLTADRLHIFFNFDQPGKIQVVELFIISNPTDKMIVPASDNQPVISFDLPQGASNLQFESGSLGQRYIQTDKGFGDTLSIPPGMGQHQLLFAYDLPYDRKLDLTLSSPLAVDAAVVLLPPGGVRLRSDQLMDAGSQDVQGMAFQMYQANQPILPGETLSMSLSGRADGAGGSSTGALLPIIVGASVFVLVLAGVAWWFIRQRRMLRPALVTEGADVETSGGTRIQ